MKNNIGELIQILKKEHPENRIALNYSNTVQLLVAVILSAQCTDVRVNYVTGELFKKYKDADDFAKADIDVFEQEIRSTGFYKNKAKNIIACCSEIADKYSGKVPKTLEELIKLPGIGRKTANVILGSAFGIPGIVVDTHVKRLAYRIGLTINKEPEKIEIDLMRIIPKDDWFYFSNMLIFHGRKICIARKPKCDICSIEKQCEKKGVK